MGGATGAVVVAVGGGPVVTVPGVPRNLSSKALGLRSKIVFLASSMASPCSVVL